VIRRKEKMPLRLSMVGSLELNAEHLFKNSAKWENSGVPNHL
jgi:hypothetical protein